MKKFAVSLILFAVALCLYAETAAPEAAGSKWTEGIVRVDKTLNLRTGPGVNFPVAGKVADKTALRIFEVRDSWLKVGAPESMTVYVSEVYIRNGKSTRELNMRRFPDSRSVLLGVLPKGAEVKIISSSSNGWAKIQAPADLCFYASRYYVYFDAAKVEKVEAPAEKAAVNAGEQKVEEKPVEAKPEVKAAEQPVETKAAEVKKAEVKKVETKAAAVKKAEVKKVETKAAEVKKAEVKKVETKAAEVKKAEVKKVEAKAAEVKKAEVKKVEAKKSVKAVVSPAANKSMLAEISKLGMDKKAKPEQFDRAGILIKVSSSNSPATDYALIAEEQNRGFLAFPAKDMVKEDMIGKAVNVRGLAYTISGWKAGVVLVHEIVLR